ncbi:MAG: C39 family peptidase [Oliverpabstia sp.]|nr:C39 family peptidase [Oliverpabstia sp.]
MATIKRKKKNKHKIFLSLAVIFVCLGMISLPHQTVSADIPEELIEFGEKYPEAEDFVNAYPQKKDIHHIINIENELKAGTIPLFIQWDERWGYESYGSNLVGIAGCGPTCLSMVYSGLTGDASLNPLEMANFSNANGYYISGQGTSWDLMTEGAQALGLTVENGTVDAEYILANLTENTPMICSMYPGDFTYTGHFIVLTGIDPEGKIMVNDPNSNINSEKHWPMEEILPQIRNIWKYTKVSL